MSKPLSDSVIWITGASSGIGEALAVELSKTGARLILSARRESELERVRSRCHFGDINTRSLRLNLEDTKSHKQLAEDAIRLFGHIDILINNGGLSQRATAMEAELDVIRKIMDVNFFGTVSLTKSLLPHFTKRESGYVVVISSVMGKIGTRYRSTYAASKHALHGWFDCLRQEMYDFNVDVTLVCPGFVRTNITVNALTGDGETYNVMDSAQENAMTPDEFAKKLLPLMQKRKPEVYIGGREVATVYLKRFFPRLLDRVLRNAKVT
ncbi:MAG: SDR family oxidoreductase [Balneolales bacterium]|nr:SDR family oxidoreductase [Balneolales bacterium]